MRKTVIIFICFLFFVQYTNAQNEIKAKVYSIQQNIDDEWFRFHKVEFNSMLAAIGLQRTHLTFYYEAWQVDPQYDPYEMDARLIMLEVTYNIAASVDYTQEYLFDEDENLMFYMHKEEGAYNNESLYYYFDKEELILLEKQGLEEEIEMLDADTETLDEAAAITRKAKSYLLVFKSLLDVEQLK